MIVGQGGMVLAALLLCANAMAADADTLVCKQDGQFVAGLATHWHAEGATVTFTLQRGQDAAVIAQVLGERLAGGVATGTGDILVVQGVQLDALLEQLAHLSVHSASDPLGDLGGMGGAVVASGGPVAGGSIRAGRTLALPDPNSIDPNERVEAEVIEVTRGVFPQVTVRLKVRQGPMAAPWKAGFKKGSAFTASFAQAGPPNGVAYYLATGDKVTVHPTAAPTGNDHGVVLDWIARVGVACP